MRQATFPRLILTRAARRPPYRQRSRLLEVSLYQGPDLSSAFAPCILRTQVFELCYRQMSNQLTDLGQSREGHTELPVSEPEQHSHPHRVGRQLATHREIQLMPPAVLRQPAVHPHQSGVQRIVDP